MFGMPTMLTVAGGNNMPTNTQADTAALQKLYAAVKAQNATPNGRVARGFNQFGPQPAGPVAPMLPTPPTPAPVQIQPDDGPTAQPPGALSPQSWAGPHSVGGAPVNPNAPMQANAQSPLDNAQWPAGPVGAPAPASNASGPDVIQKLMSYFKNKDNPSDG